jgi:tetratricopeptide (TPR) repeat protein
VPGREKTRKTLKVCSAFILGILAAPPAWAAQSETAVKLHGRALRLLAEGDPDGAVTAAREALAASSRFTPEDEIVETPEKGLLFEDMIAEARVKYRRRRGRYFLTLGEALTAEERFTEARKALHRASQLSTSAKPHLIMASQPDLSPSAKVEVLLRAYFSPGVDKAAVEKALLETDAFPDRNTLQALIDQRRLLLEVVPEYPDMDVQLSFLPELRSATERGTFVSTDHLDTGAFLILYLPDAGCNRCSEQLDGLNRAVGQARSSGKSITVAAFVGEPDLGAARRIGRLLAMRMEVGRLDRLPRDVLPAAGGEIRVVTRQGLLQVILPLADRRRSDPIRQELEAVLDRLASFEEGELTGPDRAVQELSQLERKGRSRQAVLESIDLAERREAGPGSLQSLYRLIDRASGSFLAADNSLESHLELLRHLSKLRGAGAAKTRGLTGLDEDFGRKMLEAVQSVEPSIERQAPAGQGVFRLALSDSEVFLQRAFPVVASLQSFNFVLRRTASGLEVSWVDRETDTPMGVEHTSRGGAFLFEDSSGCRGLKLVGLDGVSYEGCPARLLDGDIVEERPVLVDPLEGDPGPLYYRRDSVAAAGGTALERGLRLFEQGEYAAAAKAFEEAAEAIDPVAPYDEVDLRYNRARCLEAQGKVREALLLFETIGDVAYQESVDERIRTLSAGGR